MHLVSGDSGLVSPKCNHAGIELDYTYFLLPTGERADP